MQIELKEVHAVYSWSWDIPRVTDTQEGSIVAHDDDEDVCGICRASYHAPCPNCKYPGESCAIVVGKCGHNFHVHCISRWIDTSTSKGLCPMCRQKFELREGIRLNEPHKLHFKEIEAKRYREIQEQIEAGNYEALEEEIPPIQEDVEMS